MAKNSWIIVLGCLCWQFLYGATIKKNEVAGRIVDESSKQPMEFADVALYRATDSVFITGTVTDKRGCFAFNPVALGTDGVSGIINLVITSAFAHRPCRSRLENHPLRPLTGERQLQPPSFHPYRKYLCCRPECQSGDHLPKRTLPLRQRKRKRLGGWKRLHAYFRQGARTGGRLQLFVIGGTGRQPICHLLYR